MKFFLLIIAVVILGSTSIDLDKLSIVLVAVKCYVSVSRIKNVSDSNILGGLPQIRLVNINTNSEVRRIFKEAAEVGHSRGV